MDALTYWGHTREVDRMDAMHAEAEAAARKYEADKAEFIAAVQAGVFNALLPRPYESKPRTVASYIVEPGALAAETLLEACKHAMAGRAAVAAELLRTYVDHCGDDRAEDASE